MWVTIKDTGVHLYQTKGTKRRIIRVAQGGYQPKDLHWLETGEWYVPVPPR